MAHAYTPGLKVTKMERLVKRRILPIKGDVLVKEGDTVAANDVVARTFLPGSVEPINIAHQLSSNPSDVPELVYKKVGDKVKKGEEIAQTKGIFGLFKAKAFAPTDGTIESISSITGQMIIRGAPTPIEIKAYIDGLVTKFVPSEGVEIETTAAFIQGIFGIGPETNGELVFACKSPDEVLSEEKIDPKYKDKIIIGGSIITADALRKAVQCKIRGIIVGGIDDQDLKDFMKCDIGVAITGSENLGITLIITEGFSNINMSDKTFNLLKANEGRFACINGATQIRAGVLRPEVIIPIKNRSDIKNIVKKSTMGVTIDSPVRLIREPYFGMLGKVVDLPSELQRLESNSMARVCKVKLNDDNKEVIIPRANIEIIEE